MQAYRVETVVTPDGKIQLDTLPFSAGETVQIIVLPAKRPVEEHRHHLLKSSVVTYVDPLEPIAQEDWALLQ